MASFLVEVMQHMIDDRHLEVLPFEKLGQLPLEVDIILLRQNAEVDLAALHPEFDFLLQRIGKYTVVEYKSPSDRLTNEDLDTVRAYAMLCKRKLEIGSDADIRIAMLYSHIEADFLDRARLNGIDLAEIAPGIRSDESRPLKILTFDLAALGESSPGRLINLFSSRHRTFVLEPDVDPALLGVIRYVYENIFKRHEMKHSELRNLPEFTQDMHEIRKRLLEGFTVEERLAGLNPEERLAGLDPEERLAGLNPEERLQGLDPEERLAGLNPEELDQLLEILNRTRRRDD